jgi:hypothetical protein
MRWGLVVAARVLGRKRERVMGQLWGANMWGRVAECRVARFNLDLKQNPNSIVSNKFQTVTTFGRLEKYFPELRKIEIKYSFEDLGEMNKFLYRNFLKFGMDLG